MTHSIFKRFSFEDREDDKSYFYEFRVHLYVTETQTIATIMLNATNIRPDKLDLVRKNIPDLVDFLANLCVEYNAQYDGFHNFLEPLSSEESDEIVDLVYSAISKITMR